MSESWSYTEVRFWRLFEGHECVLTAVQQRALARRDNSFAQLKRGVSGALSPDYFRYTEVSLA